MATNTITLDELMDKYNTLKSDDGKINLIKGYVKRTYCPVIEKQAVLKLMVDKSTITEANGNTYVDMFILRINLVLAIIILYTNIIIQTGEKDLFESYDKLIDSNIVAIVASVIGEKEMEELVSIQSSILNTFDNKNNIISFICDFLMHVSTTLDLVADRGNAKLQEMIEDGTIKDLLSKVDNI